MNMKKVGVLFLGFGVLMSGVVYGLGKSPYPYYRTMTFTVGENTAVVNDETKVIDSAPYINNGRAMIPFRFLGEALGATVEWNDAKREATLKLGARIVVLPIDSGNAYVNGKMVKLEKKPEMVKGRTFLPLRFVSESLGASVNYNDKTKQVLVEYVDTTGWREYKDDAQFVYHYPTDWNVQEKVEDDVVVFTSPKGSILENYVLRNTPESNYKGIREEIENDGWKFESEYMNTDGTKKDGYELHYTMTDNKSGEQRVAIIFVVPSNGNTWVGQGFIKQANYDYDAAVMAKITIE